MVNAEVSDITLPESATIRDVIECLDRSPIKMALVVNTAGVLVATATDGDVRRGLLAGHNLEDRLSEIARREFISAGQDAPASERETKLVAHGISFLPILDVEGRVVDLHSSLKVPAHETLPNTVVIMAGGLGMRLRPMTETTPKPMLPVAGKPMLQHIVEGLRNEGFLDIVVSINYLGHQIQEYFGDGAAFGVNISYVSEEKPLGTGGALSLLGREFSEPLVVMNGDVLMSARVSDLVRYHYENGAEVTVGVKILETQIPFGVMSLDGARIVGVEEKPTYRDYVNAGIYVINPSVLKEIPEGERFDMPNVLAPRIGTPKALAFPLHESWIDLGRPADLNRAEQRLQAEKE
jgi:dTDP-glucose pyrophosphorylase